MEQQSRRMRKYYKNQMYGGRSVVARAVDFVTLRVLSFFLFYLWFSRMVKNSAATAFLSLIALLMLCVAVKLYKSMRLDKFIKRERRALGREYIRSQLILMQPKPFRELAVKCLSKAGDFVYTSQQASPISADVVLKAYHAAQRRGCDSLAIVTTAKASKEAVEFAAKLKGCDITIEPVDKLIDKAEEMGLGADEDTIDGLIIDRIEIKKQYRKKMLSSPFSNNRARAYLLAAAGLTIASFISGYSLYYRLMACACVSFSGLTWWVNHVTKENESAEAC